MLSHLCRCNLKLRVCAYTHHVPVVFHNLKGYDAHHIFSYIGITTVDSLTYIDGKGKERVSRKSYNSVVFFVCVCVYAYDKILTPTVLSSLLL